jgi:DNA-directed RNA polymerase subunit M/transcription elongation factor TFIIS
MTIRYNTNATDTKCADCRAAEITGYQAESIPSEPIPGTITRTCEDCGNDFIIGKLS